jgi:hypothetical protein
MAWNFPNIDPGNNTVLKQNGMDDSKHFRNCSPYFTPMTGCTLYMALNHSYFLYSEQ